MDNAEETGGALVRAQQSTRIQSSPAPMVLRANASTAPSIYALLEVPFAQKWLILSCILLAMGLGWLTLLVWPRTYESEAKLMIRVGRESVSLDPTATVGGQTLLIQKTRSEEVISALGVLGSRQVMQGVVDKIGGGNILDGYLPSNETETEETAMRLKFSQAKTWLSDKLHDTLVSTGLRDEISDGEMAIRKLQETVSLSAPRDSAVLSVHAVAKSPQMAQAIAESLADSFIENHMLVTRTPGSSKFFDEQATEMEQQLNQMVADRTEFMAKNDMISVGANQSILQEQLSAISREMLEANGQLMQARAELDDAQLARNQVPAEIVAAKLERDNPTYSSMRQKLFDLEVREKQLAATVTTKNPRLTVIRNQIAEIREIIAEVEVEKVDRSTTPNPARQRIEQTIQTLKTKIAGLGSLIEKKQSQHKAKREAVETLLQNQQALTQMDREIALMESSLNSLQVKLEESRVIDEMGRDKISNVTIFQPATFVERPISPKKRVIALLMMTMGGLGGLTLAYMREASSKKIRSRDHVAQATGSDPVYAIEKSWRVRGGRSMQRIPKQARKACKSVLSDLLLSHDWGDQRTLGVLGYGRGAGASTVAAYLSLVCSEDFGMHTTLVDADGKNRTLTTAFRLSRSPGLAEFASGEALYHDCVKEKSEKLSLIPFSSHSRKSQLNGQFDSVVAGLKEIQSMTNVAIVDLPAVNDSPESIALARELDYVVVVLESERTTQAEAAKLMRYLDAGDSHVLCVVLNKTRQHLPRWIQRNTGDA